LTVGKPKVATPGPASGETPLGPDQLLAVEEKDGAVGLVQHQEARHHAALGNLGDAETVRRKRVVEHEIDEDRGRRGAGERIDRQRAMDGRSADAEGADQVMESGHDEACPV
jgi:hypothetical protein